MDHPVVVAFAIAREFLRIAVFALAVVAALVAAGDWLARTRRISPFNPIARFFRRVVDPLLAPIERRVVRAGGLPSSAPWWALVVVIVGGIIVIVLFDFLAGQAYRLLRAGNLGLGFLFVLLLDWAFGIVQIALIIRVVASWLRLSPYSRWIRWTYTLTDPIIRPLQRVIPPLGMIDITPIVAYFLIWLVERLVLGVIGSAL